MEALFRHKHKSGSQVLPTDVQGLIAHYIIENQKLRKSVDSDQIQQIIYEVKKLETLQAATLKKEEISKKKTL